MMQGKAFSKSLAIGAGAACSLCPDHLPRHPDDAGGLQPFAFGYGYIKALIQAMNSEVGS